MRVGASSRMDPGPLAVCTPVGTHSSILHIPLDEVASPDDVLMRATPRRPPALNNVLFKLPETLRADWLVRSHWESTLTFTELETSQFIRIKERFHAQMLSGGSCPPGHCPRLVAGKPTP